MFRPDAEPLLPNWRHLPVGYHGRAGTVVPSGTPVRRPSGQRPGPEFGPSRAARHRARGRLRDRHAEHDGRAGAGRARARPRVRHGARERLVGPRHPGAGSTSRSGRSWASRSPRRCSAGWCRSTSCATGAWPGEPQEPEPLPYLREEPWAFDIALEVELNGAVIARSNTRHLYWSIAQQIAHLTVNGASLRTGDLLGHRHDLRARARGARQPDRAELERRGADRAARRLDAHVPRGRRRGGAARRAARRGARPDRAGATA